jgi:hypothetical protein
VHFGARSSWELSSTKLKTSSTNSLNSAVCHSESMLDVSQRWNGEVAANASRCHPSTQPRQLLTFGVFSAGLGLYGNRGGANPGWAAEGRLAGVAEKFVDSAALPLKKGNPSRQFEWRLAGKQRINSTGQIKVHRPGHLGSTATFLSPPKRSAATIDSLGPSGGSAAANRARQAGA